jgi:hypothetical protein
MSSEPEKRKDKLVRLLSDVETQAQRLETLGQDIARSARLSRDVVSPVRDLVSQLPADVLTSGHWDRLVESWRLWQIKAGELATSHTAVNSFNAVSFTVTSTSSEAIAVVVRSSPLSSQIPADIESTMSRFHQTLERFPLIDNARSSMKRLRLDVRRGSKRTPMELLNEAQEALERPVSQEGGTVSILIALRECIHSTIGDLLRRRPTQEAAARFRDKLASLGRQCARPGLQEPHFDRMAADADVLLNDLSGTKQADLPRQQLIKLFHRGLLFLNALMNSVDESRLRSA